MLKVICSILEVIWTYGRYRAALAAKKQTEKPGRSPISSNYTHDLSQYFVFPNCVYVFNRPRCADVLPR